MEEKPTNTAESPPISPQPAVAQPPPTPPAAPPTPPPAPTKSNTVWTIIVILILIAVVAGGIVFYQQATSNPMIEKIPAPSPAVTEVPPTTKMSPAIEAVLAKKII